MEWAGERAHSRAVPQQGERLWYPFAATTVIARKLVPLLLFTLGANTTRGSSPGLWNPRLRWALVWLAAGCFSSLLPEVRADDERMHVRRWVCCGDASPGKVRNAL